MVGSSSWAAAGAGDFGAGPSPIQAVGLSGNDIVYPSNLPAIGKWMIRPHGTFAHWLGGIVDGKSLREPINIIVIDEQSASAQQAIERIEAASAAASYRIWTGHSSGYKAMVAGQMFTQLPRDANSAFSNEVFELSNNHGRLFGPYRFGTAYLFVGAFGREEVRVAQVPHHSYASFNQARDDFARNLNIKTNYRLSAFVGLDTPLSASQV